jgi:hypothetical protein
MSSGKRVREEKGSGGYVCVNTFTCLLAANIFVPWVRFCRLGFVTNHALDLHDLMVSKTGNRARKLHDVSLAN